MSSTSSWWSTWRRRRINCAWWIGGEALDGAFLPFLWPLPPPLTDWDIPFLVWWLSLQSSPQIRRNALGTVWKQWIAFKSPSKLLHLHIKITLNQLLPFKWQIERQKIEFKWTRLSFSAGHVSCLRDSCPVFGTRWKFVSDSMGSSCPDLGFDRRSNRPHVGHESCPIRSPQDTRGLEDESGFLDAKLCYTWWSTRIQQLQDQH